MVDLHTHTIFSDGCLSIEQLLHDALECDIDIISITDHDTIDGTKHIVNNNLSTNITIIPGVELSTDTYYLDKRTKIHLLGYGYDYKNVLLNDSIKNKYIIRGEDNKEYIETLISKFSFLNPELFKDFEYGRFGYIRKNILKHIADKLSASDLNKLNEYLNQKKPNYRKYNFDIVEGIEIIHNAGGYAVFAHPHETELSREKLDALTKYLKENNLDGIETYHVDSIGEHRIIAHDLALKYDLYETGGSDFHCYEDQIKVGYGVPKEVNNAELVKKLIKERKTI